MKKQTRYEPNSDNQMPALPRRLFVSTFGIGALLASALRPLGPASAQSSAGPIAQPASVDDAAFIERAFEMRDLAVKKGDQAYGAVVVRDSKIVGRSWSRVILDQDPTGHAEMAAIRDAAMRLNDRDLGGAVMYSSSRPCPMCEAAAYWAGIEGMIHGRAATHAGRPQLCR